MTLDFICQRTTELINHPCYVGTTSQFQIFCLSERVHTGTSVSADIQPIDRDARSARYRKRRPSGATCPDSELGRSIPGCQAVRIHGNPLYSTIQRVPALSCMPRLLPGKYFRHSNGGNIIASGKSRFAFSRGQHHLSLAGALAGFLATLLAAIVAGGNWEEFHRLGRKIHQIYVRKYLTRRAHASLPGC